jgi:hypothetical protein
LFTLIPGRKGSEDEAGSEGQAGICQIPAADFRYRYNQCCGSGSVEIRNLRVSDPDPGPYPKIDVTLTKIIRKRSNFIIIIYNKFRYSLKSMY